MKIVAVCRSTLAHPFAGGMEQLTHDLLTQWGTMGHDVHCVTTPGGLFEADYPITPTVGKPGRYSRRWRKTLPAVVQGLEPDVVLSVSGAAHGPLLAARRHVVLLQAHGTSVDEIRTKLKSGQPLAWLKSSKNVIGLIADLRNFHRYNGAVAVSASVARTMRMFPDRLLMPKIWIVENGVRRSEGHVVGREGSGALKVGFVGRLHFEKGADRLIRAAVGQNWQLEIVGDGVERARLEKLGGPDVRFHGRVPHDDVIELLRGFSVLVVPSRRIEGLPLVVLEALSVGIPCVVSTSVAASLGSELPEGVVVLSDRMSLVEAVETASGLTSSLPAEFSLTRTAELYVDHMAELIAGHDND